VFTVRKIGDSPTAADIFGAANQKTESRCEYPVVKMNPKNNIKTLF
jgi:hypothetical protein